MQPALSHRELDHCGNLGLRHPAPRSGRSHIALRPVAKQPVVLVVIELLERGDKRPVMHHAPRVGNSRIEPDEVDVRNVRSMFQPDETLSVGIQQRAGVARCDGRVAFAQVVGERRDTARTEVQSRRWRDGAARVRRSAPSPVAHWPLRSCPGCNIAAGRRRA